MIRRMDVGVVTQGLVAPSRSSDLGRKTACERREDLVALPSS